MLNRLDPLTYAVDPMRRLVFNHLDISRRGARARSIPASRGSGWHVPVGARGRSSYLALGLGMLGIAIWEFSLSD